MAKVLVLYVYTYKYMLLKQLHEDSFPSEERGKLSTQVLSFLLYNVSYYMYIFIYPTSISLVGFKCTGFKISTIKPILLFDTMKVQ